MLLLASFFSNASFSVVFPYMAELWPAKLRASGFGLVYRQPKQRPTLTAGERGISIYGIVSRW
jgi:hypothetical protein